MTFEVSDCTYLVTWIVFIFWEMAPSRRDTATWYKKESARLGTFQIPSYVFPLVWFFLKAMLVASIFLYLKFSALSTDWTFLTVYVIFVVNVLMAKTWSLLFFEMRMATAALAVAFLLWATAVTVLIVMILAGVVTGNTGTLWAIPMALYIPYVAWLTFAVILNMDWCRAENGGELGFSFGFRFSTNKHRNKHTLHKTTQHSSATTTLHHHHHSSTA